MSGFEITFSERFVTNSVQKSVDFVIILSFFMIFPGHLIPTRGEGATFLDASPDEMHEVVEEIVNVPDETVVVDPSQVGNAEVDGGDNEVLAPLTPASGNDNSNNRGRVNIQDAETDESIAAPDFAGN